MISRKRGGVVGDLISGTGGLIVLTIVVLVIVSTLLGSNLLGSDDTTSYTITNETGAFVNSTGYTLVQVNTSTGTYAITEVWANASTATPYLLSASNYTVSTAGVLTNLTGSANYTWTNDANVSYTYVYTYDNNYEDVSSRMATNFTEGIDNVSDKIPTILLIAAVVLLFGVIVLLVKQSSAMGIGGGQNSSL